MDDVVKKNENFNLDKTLNTYNNLFEYKKHINYLETVFENNFKNYTIKKMIGNNNDLYYKYLTYNNENGITKEIIILYLNLLKMKPKYLKLKL